MSEHRQELEDANTGEFYLTVQTNPMNVRQKEEMVKTRSKHFQAFKARTKSIISRQRKNPENLSIEKIKSETTEQLETDDDNQNERESADGLWESVGNGVCDVSSCDVKKENVLYCERLDLCHFFQQCVEKCLIPIGPFYYHCSL